MTIVGHTLVWHNQTPKWVFQDTNGLPVTRDVLLERMRDHIQTVVGRYKGRIKIWDVVNEALQDNGTLRKSPWEKIIGDDYIEKAFQYAHEADPDAILRYNDYSLENEAQTKRSDCLDQKTSGRGHSRHGDRIARPCQNGLADGGTGRCDHFRFRQARLESDDYRTGRECIGWQANGGNHGNGTSRGARMLTPTVCRLPSNRRWPNVTPICFGVFVKHHDDISLVTFWGVTDGDSWLNMRGRVNHPLLFDRAGQPKPAFDAIIKVAQQAAPK